MLRAAATLVGLFVLVVLVLWWRSDDVPEVAVTPQPSNPRAAQASPGASTPAGPPARPEPGVPFLDPSGAATLAYSAGDYPTALAQFQEAVQKNPNDAESLSNLGQVLVKLGRTD
jgi:tetratricopeptide (TPR) repeat protein